MKNPTMANGYVRNDLISAIKQKGVAGTLAMVMYYFCWADGKSHEGHDVDWAKGMPWRYDIDLSKTILSGIIRKELKIRFGVGEDEKKNILESEIEYDYQMFFLGVSLSPQHGRHDLKTRSNPYKNSYDFCRLVTAEVIESELNKNSWADQVRKLIK